MPSGWLHTEQRAQLDALQHDAPALPLPHIPRADGRGTDGHLADVQVLADDHGALEGVGLVRLVLLERGSRIIVDPVRTAGQTHGLTRCWAVKLRSEWGSDEDADSPGVFGNLQMKTKMLACDLPHSVEITLLAGDSLSR